MKWRTIYVHEMFDFVLALSYVSRYTIVHLVFYTALLVPSSVTFASEKTDNIYAPPEQPPTWGLPEIRSSHIVHHQQVDLPTTPAFEVNDLMNLFLVVEQGSHYVTILDGDTMESVHRFQSNFTLHGRPHYSPSGRFVYFTSDNGWISKYDIHNLKLVSEIRAGVQTRNLALSADGRYVMVANYLPHSLVLLDAKDLSPVKWYDVRDSSGKSSRVSVVYTAPPHNSFIAAFKDIPEVWEIYYGDDPPVGFDGWVHDYRIDSGENLEPEPFPVRRIRIDNILDEFFFDHEYVSLVGTSSEGNAQVIDMDLGRTIVADLDLPGIPHSGSAITWQYKGKPVLAIPNLGSSHVSVIDMESWKPLKQIDTLGPGRVMGSHKNASYIWVDVFSGPNKGTLHVIDKRTLEIIKTVQPEPDRPPTDVAFSSGGKFALISIWHPEGALVVYDTETLKEIKRLPMNKPSGISNIYNSTRYVERISQ